MSVATEERAVLDTLDRVEDIETVANTLPEADERRDMLREIAARSWRRPLRSGPARPRRSSV